MVLTKFSIFLTTITLAASTLTILDVLQRSWERLWTSKSSKKCCKEQHPMAERSLARTFIT